MITIDRLIRLGLVGCILTAMAALSLLLQPAQVSAVAVARPAAPATPTLAANATGLPTYTPVPVATHTSTPTATPIPTPQLHRIGPEDTFYSIARTYGVTVSLLRSANPSALLVVGDALRVPPAAPARPPVALPAREVNGVPLSEIIVMPPAVQAHIRDIYAYGQLFERDPRSFAKVGDSTIGLPFFLAPFDGSGYRLGSFARLQPVIDRFSGSFQRDSVAVQRGFHAWNLFDPLRADAARCGPSEPPIACEFRLQNPVLVIIRLGANDAGTDALYEESMRGIIAYAIDQGVIPILSTRADRTDGPDAPYNALVRSLADEYQVPLWDFDRAAEALPGRGLGPDGVHLNHHLSHDYGDPAALSRGDGIQNLTALYLLEAVVRVISQDGADSFIDAGSS
jgi:LysM repeat protein